MSVFCFKFVKDNPLEVRLCPSVKCPLWVYRFGTRQPKESPSLTEIRMTEAVLETNKDR